MSFRSSDVANSKAAQADTVFPPSIMRDIAVLFDHPFFLRDEQDSDDLLDFVRESQMEHLALKLCAHYHMLRLQRAITIDLRLKSRGAPQTECLIAVHHPQLPWHRRLLGMLRKPLLRADDRTQYEVEVTRELKFWQDILGHGTEHLQEAKSAIGPAYAALMRQGFPPDFGRTAVTPQMWEDLNEE
ncbi:hypothetical protein BV25DRAFT_1831864 [Artomyces pyxidatus]|uniref:Uncharacterized protein n=1 Tax=Artomyces pyxidatus TaxID=48021 RepID=A0ACB8SJN1_9AGAM|nr:hypothetical protein BV25DRAFT_1831864 [Artomyces pyxidatus]